MTGPKFKTSKQNFLVFIPVNFLFHIMEIISSTHILSQKYMYVLYMWVYQLYAMIDKIYSIL